MHLLGKKADKSFQCGQALWVYCFYEFLITAFSVSVLSVYYLVVARLWCMQLVQVVIDQSWWHRCSPVIVCSDTLCFDKVNTHATTQKHRIRRNTCSGLKSLARRRLVPFLATFNRLLLIAWSGRLTIVNKSVSNGISQHNQQQVRHWDVVLRFVTFTVATTIFVWQVWSNGLYRLRHPNCKTLSGIFKILLSIVFAVDCVCLHW